MMTNAQLATASLDDIVFDGRNQTYGAYLLRQLYQRHLMRALLIALSLLALLVGGQALARFMKGPEVAVHYVATGPVNPIVPPLIEEAEKFVVPPPATHPPRQVVVPTVQLTPPKIVDDHQQVAEIVDQDQLSHARVAATTVVGPATLDTDGLAPVETPAEVGDVMNKPEVFVHVEQMPELPGGGGTAAIVAAIQKAARYPAMALANSVEGKVFASFVVNAQGEVTDLKIVKGLGSGLDEETLRAIAKLPRFIPGKQNGRAVSVQYTVPISFKIGN